MKVAKTKGENVNKKVKKSGVKNSMKMDASY